MVSRKIISLFSITITLVLYAAVLYIAPHITLLESDRLATRLPTQFRVAFVDAPREIRATAPPDGMGAAGMDALFGEDPGTLPIEDTLLEAPLDTPRLIERMARESRERAYDLAPEHDRFRQMDARIVEISQNDARREIDIARRLVRPGPDYTLPMASLPVLRSRDIEPGNIPLEPSQFGSGLLVRAMPTADDNGLPTISEASPVDHAVSSDSPDDASQDIRELERTVLRAPLQKETEKTRDESVYTFMDDMVDIQVDTYIPSEEKPGYFRLRIRSRPDIRVDSLPRDITFIVDASRSMQQRKLDLVGRGIGDALATFRPVDRFNILLFNDTVTMFQREATYATPERIGAASVFLESIKSQGQTDVYNALLPIAQLSPRPNLPGIILVISDGNPTVGLRDSRAIINAVTHDNGLRNSIYAYGAGNTVNRYLLDLLAYRNKGEAYVSDRIEDIRTELPAFVKQLDHPLLVNMKAEYGQIDSAHIFPRTLPDFYQDKPITIYGRFDPAADDTFVARITGHAGDRLKELVFRADLMQARKTQDNIAQGWAFQYAYYLIGEISRRGEQPELIAALQDLSHQYRIRTIYDEQ